MEKFFRPVHSPSDPAETKLRHHQHQHHHRHHLHREDPESHRFVPFDDFDINPEESQHGRYFQSPENDNRHPRRIQEEDEILYDHKAAVRRPGTSSSSLSSSPSSVSSSSWFTEASVNDPFTLRHAERPQHSLSCSNIADVQREFRADAIDEPIVFAAVTHGGPSRGGAAPPPKRAIFSSLNRSHSRSETGLLKGADGHHGPKQPANNGGQLYKTASLNRSLAFSDEDLLGNARGPRRAVSSIQLPGKGILKHKEANVDIRKAKSMEVISPRLPRGHNPSGQKGKEVHQAKVAQAKADFFQGKIQFSAFLDEITKQVISPSYLTLLGVNDEAPGKPCAPTQTPELVKPELPPKKHRKNSGSERESCRKEQDKTLCGVSPKHSLSDKLASYGARKYQGSPPPHQSDPNRNANRGRSRKGKRLSPIGGSLPENRYGRRGSHLTDGTSTSPELSHGKLRHHRKQQSQALSGSHSQEFPQPKHAGAGASQRRAHPSPPPAAHEARMGLGSESSSSKSDSSRTRDQDRDRDTASTNTSYSSKQSGQHRSVRVATTNAKQSRDRLFDGEQLKVLREENSDLQQNLLQTVVCIESLESELQRTRDELSNVKDKYKSLLETHTGNRPANHTLGEHLHIAPESVSRERKYLLKRVTQLTSELDDAHKTIAALENINLPCLMKDLLARHLDSAESVSNKFPTPTGLDSLSTRSPPSPQRPHASKSDQTVQKRTTEADAATAFVPFKQEVAQTVVPVPIPPQRSPESSNSPPFSVEDISATIYQKLLANYAGEPLNYQRESAQSGRFYSGERLGEKEELLVTLLEQDAVEVDSVSAQQILDQFMQQLHAHERGGESKEHK
ncbi:uncharacterized protein LOC144207703 [Stigmatopora nigra]